VVWEALLDPVVLSRTLPGCEDLRQTDERTFEGQLAMKVGPVQGIFQGKVALSNLEPPRGYTLSLSGKGAPGYVNGKGRLELEESGAASTLLRYEVDAQVGGRIAGVGQRLLESSAKVITRQALEGLDAQIRERSGAAAAAGEQRSETQKAPSQTRFLMGFVGGVLGEIIPRERRGLVVAAAIGIALVVLALVLRACGTV
jgi:hypothetical protein